MSRKLVTQKRVTKKCQQCRDSKTDTNIAQKTDKKCRYQRFYKNRPLSTNFRRNKWHKIKIFVAFWNFETFVKWLKISICAIRNNFRFDFIWRILDVESRKKRFRFGLNLENSSGFEFFNPKKSPILKTHVH